MKKCPRCDTEKPQSDFSPNPNTGRLTAYCNACRRIYQRERIAKNPDAERARQKRWRQRNWDAAKHSQYKWREANPEKVKANQKRWREKYLNEYMREKRQLNRNAVYAHYGEQCKCCGEAQRFFLTIDHIENDGADHRRSLKGQIGKGGASFYDWLVRMKFPTGFQTLCRNCNWGKHANGGICPHQDTEGSTTRAEARRVKRPEARGTPSG